MALVIGSPLSEEEEKGYYLLNSICDDNKQLRKHLEEATLAQDILFLGDPKYFQSLDGISPMRLTDLDLEVVRGMLHFHLNGEFPPDRKWYRIPSMVYTIVKSD